MTDETTDEPGGRTWEPGVSTPYGGGGFAADAEIVSPPADDLELAWLARNDIGNAERLIARHGGDLIFVDAAGWFVWDGKRWNPEAGDAESLKRAHLTAKSVGDEADALEVRSGRELAVATEEVREGEDDDGKAARLRKLTIKLTERVTAHRKFANACGNATKLKAMLSESEPYLRLPARDLDAHPFLLNLKSGILELGAVDGDGSVGVRPVAHRRDRLLTKLAPVEYDPEATCPKFDEFLLRIQPEAAMRGFLQRWFGYCLTGDTGEQVIAILQGKGANGKSTLLELIGEIFGNYAMTLPVQTFLHDDRRRGGDATPDLAMLPGVRVVMASEPEVGARLSESMIKSVTGGERITARHLFRDMFEFKPSFKPMLSVNIKPNVRGADDGIWRRIMMVPFPVQIPKAERRNQDALKRELMAEASGILNWLLDGYRAWREGGLRPPATIAAATDEYKTESNPIALFMVDCVEDVRGGSVESRKLYGSYVTWAKAQAQEPVTGNLFSRRVGDMGYTRRKSGTFYWRDIQMKDGWDEEFAPHDEPPAHTDADVT